MFNKNPNVFKNLDKLEEVLKLMTTYKIDFIEVNGLKVTKSYQDITTIGPDGKPRELTDEEILMYSAR